MDAVSVGGIVFQQCDRVSTDVLLTVHVTVDDELNFDGGTDAAIVKVPLFS